jgi:GNAT superfamily N-acetyltransferase
MNSGQAPAARISTASDIDAIVAAMTTAFFDDPLWGPVFPDRARRSQQAAAMWRLFITSAQRYPWMLVTSDVSAAALWIPPGGSDLSEHEEHAFDKFLVELCGQDVADGISAVFEVFEQNHPREPHFYLSLLATHRDHRGKGVGMGLLRESLARIDAIGSAAYLESCNPVNNDRYRGVGFEDHGHFVVPSGHIVTTMWRPPQLVISPPTAA